MHLLPAFTSAPEVNRVYNVTAEAMLTALPDDYIDLIVTSPPYDSLRTYNGFTWDFEYIAKQSYRVLKPGGVLVWVVGDSVVNGSETLTCFEQALYFKKSVGFRMHDTMIYEKQGASHPDATRYDQVFEYMFVFSKDRPVTINLQTMPSRWAGSKSFGSKSQREADGSLTKYGKQEVNPFRTMPNIWKINAGFGYHSTDALVYEHPAAFPETLAERHILTWSNPGEIVLDYFGGSGTTAKMARKNGRDYITNDISRVYCDLIERRLSMPYTPSFMPILETA